MVVAFFILTIGITVQARLVLPMLKYSLSNLLPDNPSLASLLRVVLFAITWMFWFFWILYFANKK